jgi:hypothetical protein
MKEGTAHIIGFGGKFYTYWHAYTFKDYYGDQGQFNLKTSYQFLYNLSHNLEEAGKKNKILKAEKLES